MVRIRSLPGRISCTVVVPSRLGWLAMRWEQCRLSRLTFGHDSPQSAWRELGDWPADAPEPIVWEPDRNLSLGGDEDRSVPGGAAGWEAGRDGQRRQSGLDAAPGGRGARSCPPDDVRDAAECLLRYADGVVEDLRAIPLDLAQLTGFRRRVTEACRAIPYGETLTYAELAEQVGSPRGARAVGNVMRRNPWPLVIPCHRVVGSAGGLGGYSAPSGLAMKRRLLDMEAAALARAARRFPADLAGCPG